MDITDQGLSCTLDKIYYHTYNVYNIAIEYIGAYIHVPRRPRPLLMPCQSVVFNRIRALRWHYITFL